MGGVGGTQGGQDRGSGLGYAFHGASIEPAAGQRRGREPSRNRRLCRRKKNYIFSGRFLNGHRGSSPRGPPHTQPHATKPGGPTIGPPIPINLRPAHHMAIASGPAGPGMSSIRTKDLANGRRAATTRRPTAWRRGVTGVTVLYDYECKYVEASVRAGHCTGRPQSPS